MWRLLLFVLVLIGIGVAGFSLYNASVTGTMQKMGLVGSDFSASVITDKLDQSILSVKSTFKCGLPTRIKQAASFLLSSDEKQGQLAFTLGVDRINCGAAMIAEGHVETGTYELLKGIGYMQSGYKFASERMNIDYRVCHYLPDNKVHETVYTLLAATSGRVHELIFNEWGKVIQLSEQVEPVCLKQRMKTR